MPDNTKAEAASITMASRRRTQSPMSSEDLLKRVTSHPDVLGGRPVIRGLRISVRDILDMLAGGAARSVDHRVIQTA